jgi:nicotinate-nucleotide adenylyltransferase
MDQRRRIGIYGGTFDPVHLGHIEVVKSVLPLFELDQVLFVPALHAPHKLARAVTSPLHRYAMLTLATQDDFRQVVSTFELDAPDRRYTVETVAHFQAEFGKSAELFFIMGADSWAEITTWRDWERLLSMTNHIVVTRPHFELRTDHLGESVRKRIVDLRGVKKAPGAAEPSEPGTIFISDAVMVDISATEIRRVANEKRVAELLTLVPEPVAEYIRKYSLYRDSNEA